MPRYIDSQKIHYFKLANGEQVATKESIDKIHAADVHEVKHGHWEYHGRDITHYCSVCGEAIPLGYEFIYCPNCGAKMDEEENKQ